MGGTEVTSEVTQVPETKVEPQAQPPNTEPDASTNATSGATAEQPVPAWYRYPPIKTTLVETPILPAVYKLKPGSREPYHVLDMKDPQSISNFIASDLNIPILDSVSRWLWFCKPRFFAPRPLHVLANISTIFPNDRTDHHLLINASRTFIKPLPSYLLNQYLWSNYICPDYTVYRNAIGLVRSYGQLIVSEIDFAIALEQSPPLLPKTLSDGKELTYHSWRTFISEFSSAINFNHPTILAHTRWEHGELPLSRLNLLFRFSTLVSSPKTRGNVWGYYFGHYSYTNFLYYNFAWLAAIFAYISIVQGAMQIGLSVPQLEGNVPFANASYGFAVFCCLAPLIVSAFLVIVPCFMAFGGLVGFFAEDATRGKREREFGVRKEEFTA